MKRTKIFFVVFILLVNFQLLFSQDRNENLVLFDSIGEASCEDLLVRIDGLVSEINKNPNSKGYIVIYGGLNAIENNFHKSFFTMHIKMRGYKEEPYSIITAKGGEKLNIEFWISKDGTKPQINEQSFDYVLSQPKTEYKFAEESGELVKFDGKLIFVGDCPACCIETVEIGLLAKILNANPNLIAQVVISNKTNRTQFNRFAKIFLGEATKDYKIPRDRLKVVYGGNKGGGYIWNKKMSSVNVTLVPNAKVTR